MDDVFCEIEKVLKSSRFNCLGLGLWDFERESFEAYEWLDKKRHEPSLLFDLASLTKVFTLVGTYQFHYDQFSPEMMLLLEHRSGLIDWARLDREHWKQQVLNYPLNESTPLYSDISALRLMLELQSRGIDCYEVGKKFWGKDIFWWGEIPDVQRCPLYGERERRDVRGAVHDDNAYNIGEKLTHAGLFGSLAGIGESLLTLNKKTRFIEKIGRGLSKRSDQFRFFRGWDTVSDPRETLAGNQCGPSTFGHLGFVGNSLWIDPDLKRGYVMTSNAVLHGWLDRAHPLNHLRKKVGEMIWRHLQ